MLYVNYTSKLKKKRFPRKSLWDKDLDANDLLRNCCQKKTTRGAGVLIGGEGREGNWGWAFRWILRGGWLHPDSLELWSIIWASELSGPEQLRPGSHFPPPTETDRQTDTPTELGHWLRATRQGTPGTLLLQTKSPGSWGSLEESEVQSSGSKSQRKQGRRVQKLFPETVQSSDDGCQIYI